MVHLTFHIQIQLCSSQCPQIIESSFISNFQDRCWVEKALCVVRWLNSNKVGILKGLVFAHYCAGVFPSCYYHICSAFWECNLEMAAVPSLQTYKLKWLSCCQLNFLVKCGQDLWGSFNIDIFQYFLFGRFFWPIFFCFCFLQVTISQFFLLLVSPCNSSSSSWDIGVI